jgi:hypothetical protein
MALGGYLLELLDRRGFTTILGLGVAVVMVKKEKC